MKIIPVTKPHIPNQLALNELFTQVISSEILTNNGNKYQKLSDALAEYLRVKNILLVSSGTIALQIAIKVAKIKFDLEISTVNALTTPFSFAATSSALKWEGVNISYSDVDNFGLMDPKQAEEALLQKKYNIILPVHVYGQNCYVDDFENLAQKHNSCLIYDASHAFGLFSNERGSLLNYGDMSTLSFHATKLFSTVEGGAIIFKNEEDLKIAQRLINFGITGEDQLTHEGINGKLSEFHSCFGLGNLAEIEIINTMRSNVSEFYDRLLHFNGYKRIPSPNNSYYVLKFDTNEFREFILIKLKQNGILARRYFTPSLDMVYTKKYNCKMSRQLSKTVACLPMFTQLSNSDLKLIVDTVNEAADDFHNR